MHATSDDGLEGCQAHHGLLGHTIRVHRSSDIDFWLTRRFCEGLDCVDDDHSMGVKPSLRVVALPPTVVVAFVLRAHRGLATYTDVVFAPEIDHRRNRARHLKRGRRLTTTVNGLEGCKWVWRVWRSQRVRIGWQRGNRRQALLNRAADAEWM